MARDVMHVILEMCRMMYVEMIMLCELFNLRSVFIIRYLCSNTHVHVCCFLTYMHILLQATSLTTLHFLCLLLLFISLGLTHNTRNFTHARTHTHTQSSLQPTTQHSHYSFYLRDRMSIHELGAAEQSYLPPDLKLNKHVGVGAVQTQMEANPSITESLVVDLNKVVSDEGVDNEEFGMLCNEQFDAIIMANTIDFLNNPREVFK